MNLRPQPLIRQFVPSTVPVRPAGQAKPSPASAAATVDALARTAIPYASLSGQTRHELPPGVEIPRALLANQRWLGKPTTKRVPAMRRFATASALLASCPTAEEIDRIREDFNLSFSTDLDLTWSCTDGGSESSIMLTVYNAFRMMYALDFDAPMPVINATNAYAYLKSLGLNWHFVAYPIDGASGVDVTMYAGSLSDPRERSAGVTMLPGIMLHEARHTAPGGNKAHLCRTEGGGPFNNPPGAPGSADVSLAYGGGYAMQYWWAVWAAQHGPPGFVSRDNADDLMRIAQSMRGPLGYFCDEYPQTNTIHMPNKSPLIRQFLPQTVPVRPAGQAQPSDPTPWVVLGVIGLGLVGYEVLKYTLRRA
jgi:hypothetical protein